MSDDKFGYPTDGLPQWWCQTVTVSTEGWARFPEVVAYAAAHDMTLADAIRRLVNSGLSHR